MYTLYLTGEIFDLLNNIQISAYIRDFRSLLSMFCPSMIVFVWTNFPTFSEKTKQRKKKLETKSEKREKWDKLKISIVYSEAFGTIGEDMCKYFHEQIVLKVVLFDQCF